MSLVVDDRTRVVALVAPPGVDLVAVATPLAARLDVAVRDTDALVAARARRPVADLVLDGDDVLRHWQEPVVVAALRDGPGVVAVGSGAVEVAAVRAALVEVAADPAGAVVLLDLAADAAARVVLGTTAVPGLGPVRATWRQMYDRRHALLTQVATLTVAAESDPGATAAAVAAALAGRSQP